MTTITVWLLVAVGFQGYNRGASSAVIERFTTQAECSRVKGVIEGAYGENLTASQRHVCVQATVLSR